MQIDRSLYFVLPQHTTAMQQKLTAKASLQMQQPASEVFEANVNPEKMRHYFIASATGTLEEGKTVQWNFSEFPDQFPVTAKSMPTRKPTWTTVFICSKAHLFYESACQA